MPSLWPSKSNKAYNSYFESTKEHSSLGAWNAAMEYKDQITINLFNECLERIVHDDPEMDEYSDDCKCIRCKVQRYIKSSRPCGL